MSHLQFREVPEPFERRIELAKSGEESYDANCHGTAFFLAGILPYDVVVFQAPGANKNVEDATKIMEEVKTPQDNSICINYDSNGEIMHSTFIQRANALGAWCRTGRRMAPFIPVNSMDYIQKELQHVFSDEIYRGEIDKFFPEKYFTFSREKLIPWAEKVVTEYYPHWWA